MDNLRGKNRLPYRGFDMDVGGDSAVLTQTYVADALRSDQPRNDGLGAFRGALNGALISLVFWIALGLVLFTFS